MDVGLQATLSHPGLVWIHQALCAANAVVAWSSGAVPGCGSWIWDGTIEAVSGTL